MGFQVRLDEQGRRMFRQAPMPRLEFKFVRSIRWEGPPWQDSLVRARESAWYCC